MSKKVIPVHGASDDLGETIARAWMHIHDEARAIEAQGVMKKDIRIWMPLSLQKIIGEFYVKGVKVPISQIDGIEVLLGYEYNTMVVSHIQAELFDIPPQCVVVNIL